MKESHLRDVVERTRQTVSSTTHPCAQKQKKNIAIQRRSYTHTCTTTEKSRQGKKSVEEDKQGEGNRMREPM